MPNKNHRNKRDTGCEAGQSSILTGKQCQIPSPGAEPTNFPCVPKGGIEYPDKCTVRTGADTYKSGTIKGYLCCYSS